MCVGEGTRSLHAVRGHQAAGGDEPGRAGERVDREPPTAGDGLRLAALRPQRVCGAGCDPGWVAQCAAWVV